VQRRPESPPRARTARVLGTLPGDLRLTAPAAVRHVGRSGRRGPHRSPSTTPLSSGRPTAVAAGWG
jgi:hypothetical protein